MLTVGQTLCSEADIAIYCSLAPLDAYPASAEIDRLVFTRVPSAEQRCVQCFAYSTANQITVQYFAGMASLHKVSPMVSIACVGRPGNATVFSYWLLKT